jgi:hypothetical protein
MGNNRRQGWEQWPIQHICIVVRASDGFVSIRANFSLRTWLWAELDGAGQGEAVLREQRFEDVLRWVVLCE